MHYMSDLTRRDIIILLFTLALLFGGSFSVIDNYNIDNCVDCQTYLSLSQGDFDQSPVRRYRVIVPLLASFTDKTAGPLFDFFHPDTFNGNFSLQFSFMLVNSLLMSLFGLLIFRLCYSYTGSLFASLAGLIAVFSCRWTFYISALPLVDSLYLVSIAALLLGIRERNRILVILSVLIGPWAKESYIFLVPLILFYGPLKKSHRAGWLALSGVIVFTFRFCFDRALGSGFTESIAADTEHFGYITESLRRIFSLHGIYDILSVTGLWILLLVPAALQGKLLSSIFKSIDSSVYIYLAAVLLQVLLSTDIARMYYLATPFLAILYSMIIARHPFSQRLSGNLPPATSS